jgi:hypothetical protein
MSRLRANDGFTIMEVLTAAVIGFIVLAGTLGLLESSLRLNSGVIAKTDAMQRGRLAMDVVTQQLRSQVCLDGSTLPDNAKVSAILEGSNANSVSFYADFTELGEAPFRRTLTFDTVAKTIRTSTYAPTMSPPTPADYPVSPTRTNVVLENAVAQKNDLGVDIPFLRYYAYTLVAGRPRAELALPVPLSQADAERVARIDVSFLALPTRSTDRKQGVNLGDQVMARHSDPNAFIYNTATGIYTAAPDPFCLGHL